MIFAQAASSVDVSQVLLAALAGGVLATIARTLFQAWRQPSQLRHQRAETESVAVETASKANQVAMETIEALTERVDAAEEQIELHRIELSKARQEIARLRSLLVAKGFDPDVGKALY